MSAIEAVQDLLQADTGGGSVVALLTGGIYRYGDTVAVDSTGKLSITPTTHPAAFTNGASGGKLKPLVVLKSRGAQPQGDIDDPGAKHISTQEVVECWLYRDRIDGHAALRTAAERIYLVMRSLNTIDWLFEGPQGYDPGFNLHAFRRDDYRVVGSKHP